MVHDGIMVSGLCLSAANISFKFFESGFNLPPGTIVFDHLLNRKSQVGRKKCDPLGLAIDPHDFDRTLERFEHYDTVIGYNGPDAAVKIDAVFLCQGLELNGQRRHAATGTGRGAGGSQTYSGVL